jgi:hypothetical protein
MNEAAANAANAPQTVQSTKFILRRLEEPFQLGPLELPPSLWLFVLAAVLLVAFIYVVIMYVKDSRGIGLGWATLLGVLRLSVYALLAWVFLLPADQKTYTTTTQGKVIVLVDVSDSMHTSDELPSGVAGQKRRTRMDSVHSFLTDDRVNFIQQLEKKNPVTVYRFGTRLDAEYVHFADGVAWTRSERENPAKGEKGEIIPPDHKITEDYWRAFLTPNAPKDRAKPVGADQVEQQRLDKLEEANKKAVESKLHRGTNLGESLLAVVNREMNNRLQGIVVFTDGRSNEGSNAAFAELASRAKAARIPIFVVGVGEDRLKIKIDINELRVPTVIQPEDRFRVVTDVTGEGLAGQQLDLEMEITHVRTYKEKRKDKDGKVVEEEKEELLDIEVIEAEDEKADAKEKQKREKISLGKSIKLKPEPAAKLDKSNPPRVEVEWQLDAVALAAKANPAVDLTADKYKGRKWEIAECKEDSELKFRVRVPVDKREGIVDKKFHESERSGMKVIKKPVRVLLMAAAANRDYQFVRTLLVRETEKKRMELAIYLQLPPGQLKAREGVVQDVPPERMLKAFPDTIGQKKGDLYDLTSYDVIVAFDPDWNQLTIDQVANLKKWADKGGGFVLIGGHINTLEISRPRDGADADRYKPIQEMLPVVLDDRREYERTKTDNPFPLVFDQATAEMEFLKLDEDLDETKFKEDWMAFFYGTGKDRETVERGFFTYYPVLKVKPGSIVVARFADANYKMKDGTLPPYLVMNPDQLARVIWIGSAESWRLREYREEWHERFWTKLVRYAGAKSKGGALATIRPEMARTHVVNKPISLEARIDGPDGGPLTARDKDNLPRVTLVMPPGVDEKEIKQPILMNPRPGAKDGWYNTSFIARSPGEYELTIKVPKQKGEDSEQTATQKFIVKEANPELDNTRPDFLRMYRTCSDADDVVAPRMLGGDLTELKRRLSRPKMQEDAGGAGPDKDKDKEEKVEFRDDKLKLYFDLGNAGLIPTCMVESVQSQTSLGEVNDRWAEDFVDLWYRYVKRTEPPTSRERPFAKKMFSWVLILAVGLFCTEWLIRKLLRLA